MWTVRAFIFGFVAVVAGGAVAGSAGYASYLRSTRFRSAVAATLSDTLGLPADIGAIVPRSLNARQFNEVVVWLPDRRAQALACRTAVVVERPTADEPDAYDLLLRGGRCEISPRTWLREDYRSVLESGLRPGFSPDGPRRVDFGEMDISFQRERFVFALDDAAGRVSFANPQVGSVRITCSRLNGHVSAEPVFLDGIFSPGAKGIRIDGVQLTIPRLPVRILRLGELSGAAIVSGVFDGRLSYAEGDGGKALTLSGHCTDLELAELTATLSRPWRGRCPDVELTELRVENRRPVAISFRGALVGVQLGDVLAPWGFGDLEAVVDLQVRTAELSQRGIERFVAAGECPAVSLESVTSAIGLGRMNGDLRVLIDDITVVENRLASLNATLRVRDAGDPPNWVEGALLREVVKRILKFDLPPMLPERIEYARLGVRIEVRDEILHVYGTHGDGEKTILTVRLFGQDLELVHEPEPPFDLRPALDAARTHLADLLRGPLEELQRRAARSPSDPGPRPE